MKRYILKAVAGIGVPEEEELSQEENSEIMSLAHDLVEFECWIEEIEEE